MNDPQPPGSTPKHDAREDDSASVPESTQQPRSHALTQTPSHLAGPRYGRFAVGRFHAKGGLGEVHVALDEELHRPVALKRMQERFVDDAGAKRRFLNEAEITARLEHPGIVPIYGLAHDEHGLPCYAMRFIEGESLAEAIKHFHNEPPGLARRADGGDKPRRSSDYASLAFRQLLQRFISVCQTMAYAHSRQVIHRDIKPANIMLGPFGETLVVDWGLARELASREREQPEEPADEGIVPSTLNFAPSGSDDRVYTQAGQALGTPGYMAPEQATGRWANVGPCSDIYSLGATLYELLTGHCPIRGQDPLDALAKAQAGRFSPPRTVKPDAPRALEAICLKSMAFEPSERYISAKDLAADLEHWLADEPVSAYADSWPTRLGRFARKHRVLTVAAGVLAVAAVAILAVVAALLDQARVRIEAEQARTRIERDQARDNLAVARKNLDLAINAVDKTVTKVAEHPRLKAADFIATRKELLELALPMYEEFVKQRSADPDLESDRGRGYRGLAYVRVLIGEYSEAAANYEQARRIFGKLSAEFPTRYEFRLELGSTHNNWGNLLWRTGRLEEAESAYSQALTLRMQLATEQPGRPDLRHDLAGTHNNFANLLHTTGRSDEADSHYAAACALLKPLATEFPTRPEYREELARTTHNRANLFRDRGRIDEAESAYREALLLQQPLADEVPARPEFRFELARTHTNLGLLFRDTGRRKEAESSFSQALAIQKKLADDFPSRSEHRGDLAMTYNNLGLLLRDDGRPQEAESAHREALALQKRLVADFPTRHGYREDLAMSHNNLGLLLRDSGRLDEAEAAFSDAATLQTRLTADFPNVPDHHNHLANTLDNLAEVRRDRGDCAEAHRLLAEALPHHEAALRANPSHPVYRAFYRTYLRVLTGTFARAGNRSAALDTAGKLRDLRWHPGGDSYVAAEALAQCAGIVGKDDKSSEEKRRQEAQIYADHAMNMLRDAVAKGFREVALLKLDAHLHPLRQRQDFQELMKELEEKK